MKRSEQWNWIAMLWFLLLSANCDEPYLRGNANQSAALVIRGVPPKLSTEPSGASVTTKDGKHLGTTPWQINCYGINQRLVIELKGYEPIEIDCLSRSLKISFKKSEENK